MKASKFIERMFEGRTKGNVILTSFANDRAEAGKYPSRILATRNWALVEEFIKDNDVLGRACYFACSTMMGRVRNKDEVAHINSLFIDIDFKGVVENEKQITASLKKLKLKPSVIVHSGNGLHCYWLLDKPLSVEHSASCEDIMRRICGALAGDKSAAEAGRVLRLPCSHNSKNGEWKEVRVLEKLSTWTTYSVEEIDEYFTDLERAPLLTYKPTKRELERPTVELNCYQQHRDSMRMIIGGFDVQEALDEMVFHSTQGNGIDDTMTHVVGAMVAKGRTVEQCISVFLKPMQLVYERDREPGEPKFNERQAIRNITSKHKYFTRKDKKKVREEDDEEMGGSDAAPVKATRDQKKNDLATGNKAPATKTPDKPKKKVSSNYDFDPGGDEEDTGSGKGKLLGKNKNDFEIPPHDFWAMVPTETMRSGMVPKVIEDVGFEYAERQGFNRDAMIMSMLTVASAVIPTDIKVAAYQDSDNKFVESIRIWTANVGEAGSGKSPILRAVRGPLDEIEAQKRKAFNEAIEEFNAHPKEEQRTMDKPVRERVLVPIDASTEGVQLAFADNPEGMLGAYDELVTFFGSKARYSGKGNGGEQASRGFWLSTYDSSHFSLVRVNRPEIDCVPSCSILGGVQPTVLRDLLDEVSRNDGIVQRFNPVILPAKMNAPNRDIDPKFPLTIYEQLIKDMYKNCPLRMSGTVLHFSAKAEAVRDRMFRWVEDQVEHYQPLNKQLAAHINKYKGMFLRFAGLFHMVENYKDKQPRQISADTANMAYRFLTSVRLKHAECFYSLIIENEENEDMKRIAEFILAHKLSFVSAREIQRGSARFRNISTRDIANTVGTMVSLGWLNHITGKRADSHNWSVNPDVHQMFNKQAEAARIYNAESTQRLALLKAEKEADEIPPEKLN